MPTSTFAIRLAYLRWRWAAGSLRATDLQFAQWLGVHPKWLDKWKRREDAPTGRDEHKAIAAQLGQDVADWLYDNVGSPPEPKLWERWSQPAERVAEARPYYGKEPKQEKPARGKAAAKKPRKTG